MAGRQREHRGERMVVALKAEAVQAMDVLHGRLVARADAHRRLIQGSPSGEGDAFPARDDDAEKLFRVAIEKIGRVGQLHEAVGLAFPLCAAAQRAVGLRGDAVRWQEWELRRASTAAAVTQALRSLRSAKSHAVLAEDATSIYGLLPQASRLPWWTMAEERLCLAAGAIAAARDAVERVRPDVVHDFCEACMLHR